MRAQNCTRSLAVARCRGSATSCAAKWSDARVSTTTTPVAATPCANLPVQVVPAPATGPHCHRLTRTPTAAAPPAPAPATTIAHTRMCQVRRALCVPHRPQLELLLLLLLLQPVSRPRRAPAPAPARLRSRTRCCSRLPCRASLPPLPRGARAPRSPRAPTATATTSVRSARARPRRPRAPCRRPPAPGPRWPLRLAGSPALGTRAASTLGP